MAKYETNNKDGIRKELMELANNSFSRNEQRDTITYNNKLLDVTGSLGCWGIAQLDKNGNIQN